MAHSGFPPPSLLGNMPANSNSGHQWQLTLPDSEQGVEDHHRVTVYNYFYNQAMMHTDSVASSGTSVINNGQPLTESPFPGTQQFRHQPEGPVYVQDQFLPSQQHFQHPHWRASELLADSIQPPTTIYPNQTIIPYPLAPASVPHEQYPFHGGPQAVDQPLPYLPQPDPHFRPPQQQGQSDSEHPPAYLTMGNVPGTRTPAGGLLLAPPAYNYATNHPSSAKNEFLISLLEKGAHRLAYVFMDASTGMWIYACNNVVGKDGPTEILMDRMINNAGFRKLLQSPHLQPETCTVTVQVPNCPGGHQVVDKDVPADPKDMDFMRAFRNELHRIPDRIYGHVWRCSRDLLQPRAVPAEASAQRKGIFPSKPGLTLDADIQAKFLWAFTKNEEWGFGIFHEIIEDENGFRPGQWFQNTDFITILQEGMFDSKSPCWFGFIESTTDMESSWKPIECPSAHLFAVAISWLIVTARIDFLKLRTVSTDWVSNTRVEEVKALTKFLEPWLLNFWQKSGQDSEILLQRAEGLSFMLRHGPSPLQDI